MKSSEIKLLEEEDYFFDDFVYYFFQDDYSIDEMIDYSIDEMGLVDWTTEIPITIRRLKKIESLLNPKEIELVNKLEHFWPK